MQVNGPNHLNALRLVRPPQNVAPPTAPAPAAKSQGAQPTDAMSFEAAYAKQLPRIELTEAHRQVERIRSELVAGRTSTPIYFESSPAVQGPSANPYANPYMKLAPTPGDANMRATESLVDPELG